MILGMCRRYCAPPETVILNVVSAMNDFSTSASLQLSQELDPEGQRTLLCVTKIDQHHEVGLWRRSALTLALTVALTPKPTNPTLTLTRWAWQRRLTSLSHRCGSGQIACS